MTKSIGLLVGCTLLVVGCASSDPAPKPVMPEAEVQAKAAEQARLNPTKNAMEVRRERENSAPTQQ